MSKKSKILYLTNKIMVVSDYKADYKTAYDEATRYYDQIRKPALFKRKTHVGTDFAAKIIADSLLGKPEGI